MAGVSSDIPVLEVGGTHVTAALVRMLATDAEARCVDRRPLAADGTAGEILDTIAAAGAGLGAGGDGATWGVAMPGPLDYPAGVGWFRGVSKFESLYGVDVGAGLAARLGGGSFRFLNDAAAFGIGEWLVGSARDTRRALCITLGTGIGAAFIADGVPVQSGDHVPPGGVLHVLEVNGQNLEDIVSRRGLLRAYGADSGGRLDVLDMADRARQGEARALAAFDRVYGVLADAMRPWISSFGAEALVVGGSIARSWDLIERYLAPRVESIAVRPAGRPDDGSLIGAASWAVQVTGTEETPTAS